MQTIKNMVAEQRQLMNEFSAELLRKEITPSRIAQIVKLVSRNTEMIEHVVFVIEALAAECKVDPKKLELKAGATRQRGLYP